MTDAEKLEKIKDCWDFVSLHVSEEWGNKIISGMEINEEFGADPFGDDPSYDEDTKYLSVYDSMIYYLKHRLKHQNIYNFQICNPVIIPRLDELSGFQLSFYIRIINND